MATTRCGSPRRPKATPWSCVTAMFFVFLFKVIFFLCLYNCVLMIDQHIWGIDLWIWWRDLWNLDCLEDSGWFAWSSIHLVARQDQVLRSICSHPPMQLPGGVWSAACPLGMGSRPIKCHLYTTFRVSITQTNSTLL